MVQKVIIKGEKREITLRVKIYLAERLANVAALDEESVLIANDQPVEVRR